MKNSTATTFPAKILAAFAATKYLPIRAGDHRFIRIWVVVARGRVMVRSWNDKPSGWYRAFREHPQGDVQLDDRELPVRGIPVRSARLNDATGDAFAAKYTTNANANT
ncbi:MAG TPA: DUF2255 family protein [Candidatus Angelobacter sp.]